MSLDDWMAATQTTSDKLALAIGVTSEAVRRYRLGARMPKAELAEKIFAATEGAVTVQDLHHSRRDFLKQVGTSPAEAVA